MRLGEELSSIPPNVWSGAGQAAIGVEGEFLSCSPGEEARPIASVSKLVASLALTEFWQTNESYTLPPANRADESYEILPGDITITKKYRDLGGRILPLERVRELSRRKAIEAMLVGSANNVAEMLVERTFGSMREYLVYANAMLRDMGLDRTTLADATGFSEKTIGTPSELVMAGLRALDKIPDIAAIVAQPQIEIPSAEGSLIIMDNRSPVLGKKKGVVGLRTGYTNAAGKCLVYADLNPAKDGQGKPIVGAIIGSDDDNIVHDSMNMLEWAKQIRR